MEFLVWETMDRRWCCLKREDSFKAILGVWFNCMGFLFLIIGLASCVVSYLKVNYTPHWHWAALSFSMENKVVSDVSIPAMCSQCYTSMRKFSSANSEFPSDRFAFYQHLKNAFPLAIIMLISIKYDDLKPAHCFWTCQAHKHSHTPMGD